MAMKRTDVIISGGGMVGLTLALALGQGGLEIVVVDTMPKAEILVPAFDGRVSALAYAVVRMLRALSVWPHLEAEAQPIREILVSDGAVGRTASPFSLHFDAQEVGADSLGHIAENRHIRAALYAAMADQKNITLIAPASVASLTVETGHVTAKCTSVYDQPREIHRHASRTAICLGLMSSPSRRVRNSSSKICKILVRTMTLP